MFTYSKLLFLFSFIISVSYNRYTSIRMSSLALSDIQNQFDLYGSAICMILGCFGNVFIMIIFGRQRQSACSIYLLSSAIANILYLILNGFIQIFPYDYTNATSNAFVFCKIYIYIRSIVGQVTKTLITLACIDRYLITSDRATFRAFSTPKRAKQIIGFCIIFWTIFGIHVPAMFTITDGDCGTTGVYSTIFTIYAIICIGGGPAIIMGVFGYLAYRNMRKLHLRVQPIAHNPDNQDHVIRRKDQDLLVIVIAEVFVYVITIVPFPLINLEMMISQYVLSSNKTFQYLEIEIFILSMAYFLLFLSSATPFYIYLMSSKAFRRDFKQLIRNGYRKLRRQPAMSTISGGDRTVSRRDGHN